MLKACKVKTSAGIKITQFCAIWVRIVEEARGAVNKTTRSKTEIALDLRNLETSLQEIVLNAEDRDELLLIQETFRQLQESEDAKHLGYAVKNRLYG